MTSVTSLGGRKNIFIYKKNTFIVQTLLHEIKKKLLFTNHFMCKVSFIILLQARKPFLTYL